MGARCAIALGLLAIAGCEAAPLTEIVVVADTDLRVPSELDAIRISVTDEQGREQEALAALGAGAPRPVTLGLVSSGGEGLLEIVVVGERGGIEILRRTARVAFARGRTLALRADLWSRCAGELCGAERTCGDAGCRAVDVAADELEDWTGAPPPVRDAGIGGDASFDGGRPSDAGIRVDASDASSRDAGAGDAEVAPDAYVVDAFVPECAVDEDCADEWTCTLETCDGGRCTRVSRDEACDDGIACTTERCDAIAGCVYEAIDTACDDAIPCTTDVCDRLIGCRNRPDHVMCEPGSYCDTATGCSAGPTFTEIYTSIIQVRCGPCHTTAATRGGMLDLSTQALAYAGLVGVTAVCGAGANTRVMPGDASSSLLWRKVAGVDLCGSRMPRGMVAPLDEAQVALIAQWISAGALE
ncbi:MAG: hypothetical protein M3Y87_29475 [Myxococcota bacterium]|nr:hypothetical protein [Myxococcota bacterium]